MSAIEPAALASMFSTIGIFSKIPDFNGTSEVKIDEFISQIEYISSVGEWPADKLIALAKSYLKGEARLFLRSHPTLNSTQDWDFFRNTLKEQYDPKPDNRTTEKLFVNCYQTRNENIATYASRLRTIAGRLLEPGITAEEKPVIDKFIDKRMLQQFTSGIIPTLQRDVLIANPKTFDEAIVIAKRMEEIYSYVRGDEVDVINNSSSNDAHIVATLNNIVSRLDKIDNAQVPTTSNNSQNFYRPNNTNSNSNRNNQQHLNQNRYTYTRNHQGNNRYQNNSLRNPSNTVTRNQTNIMCFHCQNMGHFSRSCPEKQSFNSKKCNRCKKNGHLTIDCKVKINPNNSEMEHLNCQEPSTSPVMMA